MRLIAYSSGAWPCGIADYHAKLAQSLAARLHCDTIALPTGTVYRDHPRALLRRRREYTGLAARSAGYDASLLHLVTQWNGSRAGENMLPAFLNHLRGPLFMLVHEWPPSMDPESGSGPRRVVANATEMASRLLERGGLAYDAWLQRRLFARAEHILVHAEALRDRLIAAGVPPHRVTFCIHPVPELPQERDVTYARSLRQRFAGRRLIVLFGFPHPRKSLELAVQALPDLPSDVMLLFVGGVDGAFRQQYVRSLLDLADRLAVRDRVEFVGEVPETSLAATLSLAELALAPFSYATGSGSFAYLMAANVLFDRSDPAALVDTVQGLLNDADRRYALAAQNRAFVNRHTFSNLAGMVHGQVSDMIRARPQERAQQRSAVTPL
jgi:glycosyltransferase involved in cell wall biosynthesis